MSFTVWTERVEPDQQRREQNVPRLTKHSVFGPFHLFHFTASSSLVTGFELNRIICERPAFLQKNGPLNIFGFSYEHHGSNGILVLEQPCPLYTGRIYQAEVCMSQMTRNGIITSKASNEDRRIVKDPSSSGFRKASSSDMRSRDDFNFQRA
ncbi:hypothetical protein CROQUDRAFT_89056 [Cronartium quercuum f. sp. fusiforme G11]|uniref:Uncharacterized protein n=1 Tax=Cronartium quercuum f. sp. fusiforme G11 TaxID=708437 RepID=A0A9P6NLV2_9BASI|nr:hypothetical protein CROQUDRAFT_89056 [Cronartium quercuum f. sp. fusiforme G11]